MSSLDTAIAFLYSKVNVDEENEAMIDSDEYRLEDRSCELEWVMMYFVW